jgi:hypothetical protein
MAKQAEQPDVLPGHPVRTFPAPVRPRTEVGPALRVGGVLLALVLVLVLVVLAPRLVLMWDLAGGPAPADRARAVNDVRGTTLQGLAGAALLVGVYFTWRQVQLSREGQITERLTRAVGQLGEASIDVRLGGIYALERIAKDSTADRFTIREILCAYVRLHAPVAPASDNRGAEADGERAHDPASEPVLWIRAADVQAAVTVLGRLPAAAGRVPFGLSRVDLHGANLFAAQLPEADLHYSDLSDANLISADLRRADLTGTLLVRAGLFSANLHQADVRSARLSHARLDHADLRAADLAGADLTAARLADANLDRADLRGTNLSTADLSTTSLNAAVADERTQWPTDFDHQAAGVISRADAPPLRPPSWSEVTDWSQIAGPHSPARP